MITVGAWMVFLGYVTIHSPLGSSKWECFNTADKIGGAIGLLGLIIFVLGLIKLMVESLL